jgi:hypothetical protein
MLSKLLSLIAGLLLVSSVAFAGYAVTYTTNAFGYGYENTYVTFNTTTQTYGYTDYPTNNYSYNTYGQYYYNGAYYYPNTYVYRPTYYIPTYYTYTYVTPVYYTYPVAYRTGWYYS